jgi:hypothetical protein
MLGLHGQLGQDEIGSDDELASSARSISILEMRRRISEGGSWL